MGQRYCNTAKKGYRTMKGLMALCVFLALTLVGCTMMIQVPTPQPGAAKSDQGSEGMNMGSGSP